MRDYDAEVPRGEERVIYKHENSTKVGRKKPYNELLYALGEASRLRSRTKEGRKDMQNLAWFLGIRGQHHACEVIMEHAKEPEPRSYMYGPF